MGFSDTYKQTTDSPEQTKALAAKLAHFAAADDVIVLTGDLGAGKTQFTQGFAAALGVAGGTGEGVVSPTFNILLSYEDGRLPLFHFDLYRLDDASQLEDVGFYDALDQGGVTLIEWGDRFEDELPDDRLLVNITADSDGVRTLCATAFGSRSAELLNLWQGGE